METEIQNLNRKCWIAMAAMACVVLSGVCSAPVNTANAGKETEEAPLVEKQLQKLQSPKESIPTENGATITVVKVKPEQDNKIAPKISQPNAETSSNNEPDNQLNEEQREILNVLNSPAIDLSPRAVAEYLLLTGDFDGLDMALLDLVSSRVLTPFEVEQYKDSVGFEYEKMLGQVLNAESSYIQAFNALYNDLPSLDNAETKSLNRKIEAAKSLPAEEVQEEENNPNKQVLKDPIYDGGLKQKDIDELLAWIQQEADKELQLEKQQEAMQKKSSASSAPAQPASSSTAAEEQLKTLTANGKLPLEKWNQFKMVQNNAKNQNKSSDKKAKNVVDGKQNDIKTDSDKNIDGQGKMTMSKEFVGRPQ